MSTFDRLALDIGLKKAIAEELRALEQKQLRVSIAGRSGDHLFLRADHADQALKRRAVDRLCEPLATLIRKGGLVPFVCVVKDGGDIRGRTFRRVSWKVDGQAFDGAITIRRPFYLVQNENGQVRLLGVSEDVTWKMENGMVKRAQTWCANGGNVDPRLRAKVEQQLSTRTPTKGA